MRLVLLLSSILSCSPDYGIHGHETIYVEVPGETEYVYIEDTGGEPGLVWVDSFTQPMSTNGVDILWVIDTSGSMYRYDLEVIAGIEAMLASLPAAGWRLVMISNDPNKAATETQFPLVPGDTVDDANDMYDAMGTGPYEAGFDATYEYIVNNSYSVTWMRSDAALLVVFVSDEEEQSYQYFPNVSDFTSWYGNLRPNSAFLSSIVNVKEEDSVCVSTPNPIYIGDRYMEATNHFSGIIVDICSDDWSPGVADASQQVEPYEEWQLSYTPLGNSVRVFIDTQLASTANWYYDTSNNTVYFTTIPPAQSLVEIAYRIEDNLDTADTGN